MFVPLCNGHTQLIWSVAMCDLWPKLWLWQLETLTLLSSGTARSYINLIVDSLLLLWFLAKTRTFWARSLGSVGGRPHLHLAADSILGQLSVTYLTDTLTHTCSLPKYEHISIAFVLIYIYIYIFFLYFLWLISGSSFEFVGRLILGP